MSKPFQKIWKKSHIKQYACPMQNARWQLCLVSFESSKVLAKNLNNKVYILEKKAMQKLELILFKLYKQ